MKWKWVLAVAGSRNSCANERQEICENERCCVEV